MIIFPDLFDKVVRDLITQNDGEETAEHIDFGLPHCHIDYHLSYLLKLSGSAGIDIEFTANPNIIVVLIAHHALDELRPHKGEPLFEFLETFDVVIMKLLGYSETAPSFRSDGSFLFDRRLEHFHGHIEEGTHVLEARLFGDDFTHFESGDGSAKKRSWAFESYRQNVLAQHHTILIE